MVITLPVSSLGIWVWEGKPGYRFILNTNGHRSYFVVTMTKEDPKSAWPSEWGSPCSLPASLCLIWFFWFYFWLWTAAPRDCSAQLCPVLCSRMDCGPPGSSAHAGFPARMREWGATSYCRGPSEPGVEPASPDWQASSLQLVPPGKPSAYWASRSRDWWESGACAAYLCQSNASLSDPPETLLTSILILQKDHLWFCYFF